ncbi:MAG: hypothetical protein G01um101433_817 [Parcubacteria group bacterium Gr01-1014_33]|nr:MAG: hypothetical protein G01um101433_817 [Parcubacteria group bacterium Gr01-1014_33]
MSLEKQREEEKKQIAEGERSKKEHDQLASDLSKIAGGYGRPKTEEEKLDVYRRMEAEQLGLSPDTPWEEIKKNQQRILDRFQQDEIRRDPTLAISVRKMEQITTRGDGKVETGEEFRGQDIDFGVALEHLKIHQDGEVAGSQFNGEIFRRSDQMKDLLGRLLPFRLQYDQYGRAELTFTVSHRERKPIGWTGVKSHEEIKRIFPGAVIEKQPRMPGGIEAEEQGIQGSWYPEMARNPETGQFVVARDEQGSVKNLKGKFEPLAYVAAIPKEKFQEISATDKITVIIQKDTKTGRPVILTVFPGENAPAFPTKIDSADYKMSTLGDTKETSFWEQHAFIQAK